jgi:hypothetical protein
LPIKPVHGFGIFAIEPTAPFLIPVSVVSALIIVVWGGTIGTPRGPITPTPRNPSVPVPDQGAIGTPRGPITPTTTAKPIWFVVRRIPVRTISRVPVGAVSGVPIGVIRGSSIKAIRKVTGRVIRGA